MSAKTRRSTRVMPQAEDMPRLEDHEQRIRALEFNTDAALYQVIVFRPDVTVTVGDDKAIFHIPPELDQSEFIGASASLHEAGGGDCQVQLRHSAPCETGDDLLTSKLTIQSGDCYDDRTVEVDPGHVVSEGDHIHIDVDLASGIGMDVSLAFLHADLAAVLVDGLQGPPGGVTEWTGAFDGGASYTEGQAVSVGGTTYVAITNVPPGIIPGVTPGWEAFWHLLIEGHDPFSGIQAMILGNGYVLDTGVKAAIPIPFDCEIVEATLLASNAGDIVVDLWVDTYGSYPPTDADSITAGTPPTLSGANKMTDTTLTGWTTTLTAGDVLMVVIESVSDLQWVNMALRVQRP